MKPETRARPASRPQPSGATAIAAGVLAMFGSVFHLIGLLGGLMTAGNPGASVVWRALLGIGCNAVLAGLLGAGGVLLCSRKSVGRALTVVGCAGAMVMYVLFAVADSALLDAGGALPIGGIAVVLTCAPALAAMGLAISPPTKWWLGT